jgi:excisionase family DNA binding protein
MQTITERHESEYLAPKEVARELGLDVSRVYAAVKRGDLAAVRLTPRGAIRIPRSTLEPRKEH